MNRSSDFSTATGQKCPATGAEIDKVIVSLGARQHAVVALRQLLALGIRDGAARHRLSRGGLHLLFRGVFAVGRPDVSRRGRWLAAVLTLPEGALLSHLSAAALWGILSYRPGQIHLTWTKHVRGQSGIRVHEARTLRPGDRAVVDRIPVTSISRTLVDLAATESEDTVREAFEEAERLKLLSLADLRECRRLSGGRAGARIIHGLVDAALLPTDTRSKLEARFEVFRIRSGLPEPLTNHTVLGYETDIFWPDPGVAVELDSWGHHGTRRAFERDRRRDAHFHRAGIPVLRITWDRLTNDETGLLEDLRALLNL